MAKKKQMSKTPKDGEAVAVDDGFDDGPEVSPYTSPSCIVYFKGGHPFIVPHDIICVSVELDSIRSQSNEIHIQDVPAEAGHVLVHYLHTRTWETLRKGHSPHHSKISAQFENSVYVYAAAQTYGLPGLAELARENISRYADELPALDTIVWTAEACETLPDNDPWFLTFIKTQIEQLFEDPASLDQSVLLGCFNNATKYSRILAKGMIWMCCEKSVSAESAEACTAPVADAAPMVDSLHSTPELVSEPELEPPVDIPPEPETEAAVEAPAEYEIVPSEPEPDVPAGISAEPEVVPWEPEEAEVREEIPADPEDVLWAPVQEEVVEAAPDEMPVASKKSKKKLKKSKKSKEPVSSCAATHVVDGGWEDCASCREFVGGLSVRYGSSTNAPSDMSRF